MPTPTMLLKPEGSRDRNGALNPITVGSIRTVPAGPIETPEKVNWILNPRGADSLVNISNAAGVNGTLERITGLSIPHPDGMTIETALRVSLTAATTNQIVWTTTGIPVAQGTTVTYAFLARAASEQTVGKIIRAYLYESGGASVSETTAYTDKFLTLEWQLIEVTGSVKKADRTTINHYVQMYGVTGNSVRAGDIIELTAGQSNLGTVREPFFIGRRDPVYRERGSAWLLEEATTNLETNPVAANAITPWTSFGSGLSRDPDVSDGHGASFKIYRSAAVATCGMERNAPRYAVTAGQTYTLSFRVKHLKQESLQLVRRMMFYDAAVAVLQDLIVTETIKAFDGWTTVTMTAVAPAGATSLRVLLYNGSGPIGESYWITKIQLENKPYATTCAVGDMGDGYSWSGAAHASTSYRGGASWYAELLRSPFRDRNGTVLYRARFRESSQMQYPANLYLGGAFRFGLGRYNSTHATAPRNMAISAGNGSSRAPIIPDNTPIQFAMTMWPQETDVNYGGWTYRELRHDGTFLSNSYPIGSPLHDIDRVYLAHGSNFNMEIESVLFFDEMLTDAEMQEILASPKSWEWSDTVTRWKGPKPTMLIRPDEIRDRVGSVAPVVTGPVKTVKGRRGNAWRIEPATTNLITNPRFANNNAGWSPGYCTISDDGTLTPAGNPARKLEVTSTAGTGYLLRVTEAGSITPGLAYSLSIKAKCSTTARYMALQITWRDANGVAIGGATYSSPTQIMNMRWLELKYENIVAPAGASSAQYLLRIEITTLTVGTIFWVGEPQLEQSVYATSYADGSLGAGHAWTGTADASTSTRETASIKVPLAHAPSGSMFVRGKTRSGHRTMSYWTYYHSAGSGGGPVAGTYGPNDFMLGGYGSVTANYAPALKINRDYQLGVDWNSQSFNEYVNTQKIRADGVWTSSVAAPGVVHNVVLAESEAEYIDAVVYFDRQLTEEEQKALFDMPEWQWNALDIPVPITNVVHRGGAYTSRMSLWLSDRSGRKISRIPNEIPVQGSIKYDQDTEISRSFSLEVNHPHRLDPFKDFLIPEITLTDAGGNRRTRPMGHFIVMPPTSTLKPGRFSGSIEAKDASWIIANDTLPEGVIPKGTDSGAAARELALAVMDSSQLVLPDTGVLLAEDMPINAGDKRLAKINELYQLAVWYAPWMNSDGIMVTAKEIILQTAAYSRFYSSRTGEVTIVPPIQETPDYTRLKNKVTVRNIAPERAAIYATVEVENLNSPVHPLNLGSGGKPLYLPEVIDDSEVPTKEVAREKALVRLANGASYYRKLAIRTVVDLDADAHDVIGMDVVHHGAEYTGNWIRRGWVIQTRGLTTLTESEITRVEDIL